MFKLDHFKPPKNRAKQFNSHDIIKAGYQIILELINTDNSKPIVEKIINGATIHSESKFAIGATSDT